MGVDATKCNTAEEDLWNKVIEGIEFTVYGTNDLDDANAAAGTASVFSPGGTEAGSVPAAGAGNTFEQAVLEFVFEDGWADFGTAVEGDDYASVWKFTSGTAYRYIAVFSDFTDPFIGDGFRSFDNELDAIGTFVAMIPELGADINIHPGSDPNSINTCSNGTTPITIWGTDDLDVATIDQNLLLFVSSSVKTVGKSNRSLCSISDSGSPDDGFFDSFGDPDGLDDLTCKFITFDMAVDDNSTSADVSITGCEDPTNGCTLGDAGFYEATASDSVNIVKDCDGG